MKNRPTKKQKLVIVGNGMAATRLLERLLQQAPDRYAISLFGAEPHPAYNRIMLSPVLADELSSDDILLHDRHWYHQHGIQFYSGEQIVRIDRQQRCVYSHRGLCQPYDTLVIATGSTPLLPEAVQKSSLNGFYCFRNLADLSSLQQAAACGHHALVIGGGLLGLEAAHGLNQQGCQVTVLHRAPWLLNRQLDPVAGALLAQTLQARGIHIRPGTVAEGFEGDGQVQRALLSDGSQLAVDLVVSAVGIEPSTDLARRAGLHCQRGIVVDPHLRSSDPSIFALGECCESDGHTFGLVAPIYQQAQVLADYLCGQRHRTFEQRPQATRLKISGIDLFSAGEFLDAPGLERQQLHNHLNGSYRTLLFRGNHLAGAVLFGDTRYGNDYFELIEQQQDIRALRPLLIFGQGVAATTHPIAPTALSA